MTATMLSMELKLADTFKASELMAGDLIDIDGDVCEITSIEETDDGFVITFIDAYGEKDFIESEYDDEFDLYVLVE